MAYPFEELVDLISSLPVPTGRLSFPLMVLWEAKFFPQRRQILLNREWFVRLTIVEDQHTVTIYYGWDTMSHGNDGAQFELRLQCAANDAVGSTINRGSGFVKDYNAGPLQ